MADKPISLEELPEFFTSNPFKGNAELPIYEIARLTYKVNHFVNPPDRSQKVVCVVGRSVNQGPVKGKKEYTIFCTRDSRTKLDGTTIAVNSSGMLVQSFKLDAYEILRSNEGLYLWDNPREL